MGEVVDKTEIFKEKRFVNKVEGLFDRVSEIKESQLQDIRDNPEQFIEDTRPYVEGLQELVDQMRETGFATQFRSTDVLPSRMPPSSIYVTIQDYERWKRMESTVDRLRARLGL